MNRRKMLLSTLGSTLAVNGVSIAAGTTNLLATNFVKGAKEAGLKSAVLIRLLRILMLAEAVFSVSKTQANVLSVMMFLQYCTL